jgi:DNA-binding LacI/PurR family transcriptional regulator
MLDNERAARESTEHLLSHGYSHIVAVTARYKLQPLQSRLTGYQKAMEAAGKWAETIVLHQPEQLSQEMRGALQRELAPATAILSMSYSITLAILSALRESCIVLSGIGFVGIDDMEFASFLQPALTTLAQPAEQLARTAFQQLLGRTSGSREKPVHVIVAGNMMIRSSCGCKPATSQTE